MPKFRVLMDGKFGEGYKAGDIITMDTDAAEVRLSLGEIEPAEDVKAEKKGKK